MWFALKCPLFLVIGFIKKQAFVTNTKVFFVSLNTGFIKWHLLTFIQWVVVMFFKEMTC